MTQTTAPSADPGDLDRTPRQRADLARYKRGATALLVAMLALHLATWFVAAPDFWILLLRTASEAGIVGGLADWFAVTALFRHPLGVPVPHTALIPRNKDRIGANLGQFISGNFLTREVVVARLRDADLARAVGRWLGQQRNAAFFTDYALGALPHVLRSLDDAALQRLLQDAAREQLRRLDVGALLGRILALLLHSGRHRELFDTALEHLRDALETHRDELERAVAEQSRWWVPRKVDREMARMLLDGLRETLAELDAPDHPVRQRFDAATAEFIGRLEHAEATRQRVEELKRWLLDEVASQAFLADAWREVKALLLDEMTRPSSRLREVLVAGLIEFGTRLERDPETRARLNRSIEELTVALVLPWRDHLGRFIADVVHGWDARELADRVELEVGRDLQFIRVNGTLVGSLVGALLFLAVHAFR